MDANPKGDKARDIDTAWRRASRLRRFIYGIQISWAHRQYARRLSAWFKMNEEMGLDIELGRVQVPTYLDPTSRPLRIRRNYVSDE